MSTDARRDLVPGRQDREPERQDRVPGPARTGVRADETGARWHRGPGRRDRGPVASGAPRAELERVLQVVHLRARSIRISTSSDRRHIHCTSSAPAPSECQNSSNFWRRFRKSDPAGRSVDMVSATGTGPQEFAVVSLAYTPVRIVLEHMVTSAEVGEVRHRSGSAECGVNRMIEIAARDRDAAPGEAAVLIAGGESTSHLFARTIPVDRDDGSRVRRDGDTFPYVRCCSDSTRGDECDRTSPDKLSNSGKAESIGGLLCTGGHLRLGQSLCTGGHLRPGQSLRSGERLPVRNRRRFDRLRRGAGVLTHRIHSLDGHDDLDTSSHRFGGCARGELRCIRCKKQLREHVGSNLVTRAVLRLNRIGRFCNPQVTSPARSCLLVTDAQLSSFDFAGDPRQPVVNRVRLDRGQVSMQIGHSVFTILHDHVASAHLFEVPFVQAFDGELLGDPSRDRPQSIHRFSACVQKHFRLVRRTPSCDVGRRTGTDAPASINDDSRVRRRDLSPGKRFVRRCIVTAQGPCSVHLRLGHTLARAESRREFRPQRPIRQVVLRCAGPTRRHLDRGAHEIKANRVECALPILHLLDQRHDLPEREAFRHQRIRLAREAGGSGRGGHAPSETGTTDIDDVHTKRKNPRQKPGACIAGIPGLEPRMTVPETVVLPITPYPKAEIRVPEERGTES